jgi:hypothetical protein
MKVLLKNQDTNLFVKADGQWMPDKEKATDFKTPLDAINFCHLHHLSHTAIVVSSDEGKEYEMPLRCEE